MGLKEASRTRRFSRLQDAFFGFFYEVRLWWSGWIESIHEVLQGVEFGAGGGHEDSWKRGCRGMVGFLLRDVNWKLVPVF